MSIYLKNGPTFNKNIIQISIKPHANFLSGSRPDFHEKKKQTCMYVLSEEKLQKCFLSDIRLRFALQ